MALQLVHTIDVDVVKAVPSSFHPPRILTHDLVGRLHMSNGIARELRSLGVRVRDIDAMPDDGGSPILLVDLAGHPIEQLLGQCDACTIRPGSSSVTTAIFQGARLVVLSDMEA